MFTFPHSFFFKHAFTLNTHKLVALPQPADIYAHHNSRFLTGGCYSGRTGGVEKLQHTGNKMISKHIFTHFQLQDPCETPRPPPEQTRFVLKSVRVWSDVF